ncbi:short-chain dehydrogenase/reductase SDR [Amycolatopsis mediterranei S699]|uniref:Short-chain dehydrogenase/reductase SDR n=2 Tax=Amycolatopsis mediterranei TaxID=33910 RepID=A0A0H3D623_AMYMU|nr:SDR family oxidoreductase [Amycolatopsis mediterranei]ADJ45742.1 short-chain dehydrogenase/reductase SDR [Amycolatopsis mediterranei U32]AEK42523.1 short-chain dehydrogenase/reductase SDR [Amycolatopsis mediterranei S699]AFO77453.1 short-chain dehydrogenase/reductase SDR [Amycolatopsis mediterranei S699]AGT84581.1 short-chain dehydrogenase/reductase SDR [Amycolatopsis mediterranei RB]KDO05278.1 short-chain dehydrogenase [Amycolatopsis mediterranei]
MSTMMIIGGTDGLGRFIAQRHADQGGTVVIAGRDAARAEAVAKEIAPTATGLGLDLSRPETIAASGAGAPALDHLVVTASHQRPNTLRNFDIAEAITAVTTKLVGYAEAVRVLRERFTPDASVVLFGGLAKERPYPGSTVVTTVNSAVTGLVKTLAIEIAPHRVNALHPGLVGDSPRWRDADLGAQVERTPIGRLVTMAEIADATGFLLRNGGINGHDLFIDGGFLTR